MSRRFFYYLPQANAITHAEVLARGLGYAFPDPRELATRVVFEGPDGRQGVLAARGAGAGLAYQPAEQVWQHMACVGPADDKAPWLGYSKKAAERPLPLDLEGRERCLEGYPVRLGDGHEWHIPMVRSVDGMTRLPRVIVVGEDGRASYRIRVEYQSLWNLAGAIWASDLGEKDLPDPAQTLLDIAAEALAVNYRVGPHEVGALELVDTENVKQIARALCDGPNFDKLMEEFRGKKNTESAPGQTS